MTVSEWADTHRVLTGKQSGERGRYRTSRTPFWREPMDCLSANSRVTDLVIMCSSQIGKTEVTVNFTGYVMEYAPAPMMILTPTLDSRDAWKVQKLNPMLTDTPVIRDLLGGLRSRDAANRQDMIDFPGGVLFLAGGNSPNSYAQRSVRYLVLDDLDRFPAEVGEEGDPVLLAKGRTKAFARAKRVFISTPTVKDQSLIGREWQKSDQRRYHLPCPHCGEYYALEWGTKETNGIRWNEAMTDAWYVCHCGAEIYEHQKPALLAAGRWIAGNPSSPTRGYHISALYAPIGLGPSWLDLAREWKDAVKSPNTLKTFVNTNLGEEWEEDGDSADPTGLLARLEQYPEDLKPLARTIGVDVQKDRLEFSVADWGEGEECWMVDHVIIAGDTALPAVWDQLGEEMEHWKPDAVGVDSGYNASLVYAWCERRRFAFALKGMPGAGRPVIEDERTRLQRLRKRTRKNVTVHLLGDDQSKALLVARLQIIKPGAGYIHFPAESAFDDEYFQQLTAEKLVTKIRGTRPYTEWVKTRPRNEANDTWRMCLAALRLGVNLKARATRAAAPATPSAAQATTQPPRRGNFASSW